MQQPVLAGRFVDLKRELDDEEVQGLLALSIERPTPARLEEVCQMYLFDPTWRLLGYAVGRDQVAGCIGVQLFLRGEAQVRHIAVHPERRRQGIGRAMVGHVVQAYGLRRLAAEADADAAAFFRRCGFSVESQGDRQGHSGRFLCRWEAEAPPAANSRP
ncbi:MAG: GNAT family N-acetyltransferase [Chloroflexi bacterium]|nr:GNAT family N-acetyltransferase [Chloroflexota bacterium]